MSIEDEDDEDDQDLEGAQELLSLEAWSDLSIAIAGRSADVRRSALRRAEVSDAGYTAAERHWTATLAKELRGGNADRALAYGARSADAFAARRLEPEGAAAVVGDATAAAEPALPAPSVRVPTYLLDPPMAAPAITTPVDLDATADLPFGALERPLTPFVGGVARFPEPAARDAGRDDDPLDRTLETPIHSAESALPFGGSASEEKKA